MTLTALRKITTTLTLIIALVWSAQAKSDWLDPTVELWNIPDVQFGTWSQAGDVTQTITGCVESYREHENNGRIQQRNFFLQLRPDASESNPAELFLNGNRRAARNKRIPITVIAKNGGQEKELKPFRNVTRFNDGGLENCTSGGDNVQLEFNLRGADLAQAAPGEYRASLTLRALSHHQDQPDDKVFVVSIRVQNANVRISRLDDVAFTTTPGSTSPSALTADETFCVYSASGGYQLSLTSDCAEDGYCLAGVSQSTQDAVVPLSIEFADNPGGNGLQTMQAGVPASGQGDSSSNSCNGNDNAMIRLRIDEQAINQAASGNYASTLTFLVEPT